MLTDFRLKVFLTAAQQKSFTRAARELNISQPAVSQNVAELEQQVGDTLFERGRGEVTLTQKGEILLKYAEKILHLYDNLNTELIPSNAPALAQIRIAACPIAVRFILPGAIKKFRTIHPNAQVSILESADSETERAILDGEADLGIMERRPDGLESTPFASLSVTGTDEPMLSTFFAYRTGSSNWDTIQKFILTAKTAL